ncbi:Fe-S cluster assembly protein SufD [Capnocytophaga canimorsus]|uniref:Fe-S cluster assembly protein SufD n=1 Tax=Capnocytophaga canimorsus TaxID=28188 RepID=UPI0015629041|nr:Fe-S cluster assembly protein SufD [Capnocytophaga canimorsus]
MNLQEKWLSSFDKFQNREDFLHNTRNQSIAYFKEKGFPTRKDEAWKYTSLKDLLNHNFEIVQSVKNQVSVEQIQPFLLETDSYKVVFVDGFFNDELSDINSDEILISPLSEILKSDKGKEFSEKHLNQETRKDDVFTALNTAFIQEGICIYVAKNKVIEKPIQLLFVTSNTEISLCLQPRNIIEVGENAQVKIIETHQSLSSQPMLTNSVTEIFVGDNALLDYYKVQNDNQQASLIDNTYISQQKNSNASVHTFSFGGALTRNNLNFFHHGEHLESTLKGITILSDNQHVDHYTLVNHAQPNCESHQDYKTILSDKSAGVFNGKIMVEKIAQKTNAYQQNDTILLSDKANINTKPQLEIFADDVKCSHGCTVGELNKEALFYLQARGIPKKEGEALLTYAFANTVLDTIKIPALKDYVSQLVSKKLGVNINL